MAEEVKVGMGKAAFVLFAILLLASASLVTVALQEASPTVKGDVTVDSDGILQTFLSSTIERTSYTDLDGNTRVYSGWSVESLLAEDMELRMNMTAEVNASDLGDVLEKRLGALLGGIAGEHHYNLKVSFRADYFRIKDLNIEGGSKADATIPLKTVDGEATVTLHVTE